MSIVYQALKKAAREKVRLRRLNLALSTVPPRSEKKRLISIFKRPVVWAGSAVLLVVALAFVIGAVYFATGPESPRPAQEVASAPAITASVPTAPAVKKPEPTHPSPDPLAESARLVREGKLESAEQILRETVRSSPASAVAHNNLGLVLKARGLLREAEGEYLEALRLLPNYPEAMNNLGLLYEAQGRVGEAMDLYRRALDQTPRYPEANLNYALLLERLGYADDARRHYLHFLADAPPELADVARQVRAKLDSNP